MKYFNFAVVALLAFGVSRAVAETKVRFTDRELKAAYVLVRPELNSIEVNGRSGTFSPAPALRFFGLGDLHFQFNFNDIVNLVDLEFNHLKAKTPQIQFTNGALELTVPLYDQNKVLQSKLGSISISDVSMIAVLGWQEQSDGSQRLVIRKTRFNGDMKGTGLLKPEFILMKVKGYLLKVLTDQVKTIINAPAVQESITQGLFTWAKFTTGSEQRMILPKSLLFYQNEIGSGLEFGVE